MKPSTAGPSGPVPEGLPDHTQLPDEDGAIVHNFQEHPQSNLFTECLLPRLQQLHPDGQFTIGADSGIYWRLTQPPLAGCKAPDWFCVLGVPPMLNGELRRSYVLWQERMPPLLVAEYVSGDGREERDATPETGKFWVYERGICAPYYAIYEVARARIELYRLEDGVYRLVAANAAGRYPIEPLGIELGIWEGEYRGMRVPWVRVWDSATGQLLPTAEEQAAHERLRADQQRLRADQQRLRADQQQERAETAELLVDDTRKLWQEECERSEAERRRAEGEAKRAEDANRRAKEEAQRAEDERQRTRKLAEKLRALGIDPDAA